MTTTPARRAASRLLLVLTLALLSPAVAQPALAQPEPVGAALGGPQLATAGTVLPLGAPPVPDAVVAHGWLVADLDTGEVLAAKDPHGRFAPASTLKALTAVALLPVVPADRRIVPTFEDTAVEGTRVGLVERVAYPAEELFAAMLMMSGNDAASALATSAGGPAAIARLNATAARLQARDTVARNPHGLDAEGQTSSAYDLALIAREGMRDDDFRRYVATRTASVSGPGGKRIDIRNKNKLLGSYPGALGIKNGYTSRAKASDIAAATQDGRTLVVTLMRTQPKVFDEAAALLDWGFTVARAELPAVGTLVEPLGPDPEAAVEAPLEAPLEAGTDQALDADGVAAVSPLPGPTGDSAAAAGWLSAGAVLVAVVWLRRRRIRLRY